MGGAWGSPLYRTEVHSLTRSRAHAHGHRLCPTKEKDLPSKNRCEEREKTLRRPHAAYQHTRYTVTVHTRRPHDTVSRYKGTAIMGDITDIYEPRSSLRAVPAITTSTNRPTTCGFPSATTASMEPCQRTSHRLHRPKAKI